MSRRGCARERRASSTSAKNGGFRRSTTCARCLRSTRRRPRAMAGERILVVDDNPTNMKLLSYVLASCGYDVRAAREADHALGILENFQPQLILMDVQLPGIDGLELTRRLKA